jgi:cell division protein FtsN
MTSYAQGDGAKALEQFALVEGGDSAQWATALQAARAACCYRLGKDREADSLAADLARSAPDYLEKALLEEASKHKTGEEPPAKASGYCLQVGAFAEIENAHAMENGLRQSFSDVTVVAGKSGHAAVYRVLIGEFPSKQDARSFGEQELAGKNISYTVVER